MKIKMLMLSVCLVGAGFFSASLYSNVNEQYGHISYMERECKVIRLNGTVEKAMVNLPLVPGDRIVTGERGRCEIQFDNGTVMRLDSKTNLEIETILAKSLTTRKKLTTLHLNMGQLFSIVQTYNLERFQVITPNAAILMNNRSTNLVSVNEIGETCIHVMRGKVRVKHGNDMKNLKKRVIGRKEGFRITGDHHLVPDHQKDVEFVMWNTSINKNFKKLHYGISEIPKAIYRYPRVVIYFAEKWSSLYGEWIYDEIFGYVWRPYLEKFAYFQRPFFHAQFVRINEKLFLVPTQPWGWAPAHLGTWVWLSKKGWTWIPGTAFSSGVSEFTIGLTGELISLHHFPTFGYWMDYMYGDIDLYYTYRDRGLNEWRKAYVKKYNKRVKHPTFRNVPKSIRKIVEKMSRVSTPFIKKHIGESRPTVIDVNLHKTKTAPFIKKVSPISLKGKRFKSIVPSVKSINSRSKRSITIGKKSVLKGFRTWCPDAQWAFAKKIKIQYSSKTNEVVCPRLNISSNMISNMSRLRLRNLKRSDLVRSFKKSSGFSNSETTSGNSDSKKSSNSHSRGSGGASRKVSKSQGSVKER